uniref:Acyl-CoA-binding domain-containing protein 6 n=1 Tax=Panagrolaimus sp. JU765 TaxID=591449 RepID=A0AC34PWI5_9BILA
MVSVELKRCFDSATLFFASHANKIPRHILLQFYGLYKVATEGPMPSGFTTIFTTNPKKRAWRQYGNLTVQEAMRRYIDLLDELKIGWSITNYQDFQRSSNRPSQLARSSSPEVLLPLDHFIRAVRLGDEREVIRLLDSDITLLRSTDSTGGTPLHWAADANQAGMIELFVRSRLDVDAKDHHGQTPLHIAATCEHLRAVRELLYYGASLDIMDEDNETPRDLLCAAPELKLCMELYALEDGRSITGN